MSTIMISYLSKVIIIGALLSQHLHQHRVQGQQSSVSPKLDFDDAEQKTNTSVPVMPGVTYGRGEGRSSEGETGESGGGVGQHTNTGRGSSDAGKSGPKIHGVRVTVDTGDTHTSKESKESVEITDLGKHKKRVGIHTDITFEISADGDDDANATSSGQKEDKENASVPIYKGRDRSTQKPRKPYDPKTRWNPNFSTERRGYEGTGRGSGGSGGGGFGADGPQYNYDYYPQYRPYNVPVYTNEDRGDRGSGTGYRRADGWTSYIPNTGSQWTTERAYYGSYQPNAVTGNGAPTWKPCYCMTQSGSDYRRRRESNHRTSVVKPTSSLLHVIDGKLERPFSRK